MRILSLASLALLVSIALIQSAIAQGYNNRIAVRNGLTARQQFAHLQTPRRNGRAQGGFSFDPRSGSLQVSAVRRDRFTGRLQYYNEYINPWTGARYTTGTQFNPYTGRYQTVRNFLPPPDSQETESAAETIDASLPKRGIRVIETKTPTDDSPPEVAPPLESTDSQTDSTATKPAVTVKIHPPRVP